MNPIKNAPRKLYTALKQRHFSFMHWQQGQSSTEYTIICVALILALGISLLDDSSALRQLLNAFKLAFEKVSYASSLPI